MLQGGDGLHRLRGGGGGARAGAPAERLAPFVLTGAGIPRQGNPVVAGGEPRSAWSPAAPSRPRWRSGSGWRYVAAELAEPGTEVEIDVRGKLRPARIESKPLYRKPNGKES